MAKSNKRVIAAMLVVAVMTVGMCFIACNAQENFINRLEKGGYEVVVNQSDIYAEWSIFEMKYVHYKWESVTVIKCYNKSDAKDFERILRASGEYESVYRDSDILIYGTKQAVKDAK